MATKKIPSPQDIYQIKVTLLGTNPPIWRRLLVPAALTLAQLHDVVQTAMGWQDGHMHEFRAGQRYFGKPDPEYRSMGWIRSKTSAQCVFPRYSGGLAPSLSIPMISAIAGSTPSFWRNSFLLIRVRSIRSAPMVGLPVRRKTAGASRDFTISLRPSLTPTTNSTRN